MIEIAPDAAISLFDYVAITQYLEDLFPIRVDVANRNQLKPLVRPNAERQAIYHSDKALQYTPREILTHLPRALLGFPAGNVYRHNYDNIAAEYVWRTVREDLPPLLAAIAGEIQAASRT